MADNSNRRDFSKKSALATAGIIAAPSISMAADKDKKNNDELVEPGPFKLKYAPGLGMFSASAGDDPIDNIKFCSDQGFRAVFDNGLMNKPPELQEKIAYELELHNMDLGPFVLYADFGVKSFVTDDGEMRKMLIDRMKEGVEVAKRTCAKWALVVPGKYDERLHWD